MINILFIKSVDDRVADELLANIISKLMTERLAERRNQGWSGWHRVADSKDLRYRLEKNIKSGDLLDVINLAAMIIVREELFGNE